MKEKSVVKTRDSRWIVVSGLVFVAAWVVGLVIASPPAATAPTATVIAYYQANREMAMLQTYLINGLTGAALIVFAAALRSVLRRFEGECSTLSSILFGAGMVVASLSFLEALFAQVLAWGGVITGEHGIGLAKKRWWPNATSEVVRKVHHNLKQSLDPTDILNPGKFV